MSTRHEDEEQDSLFGSPPPSPRLSTGRPASPALALPSAPAGSSTSGGRSSISTAHATTQNVGTIALPGSQPDSELPINPLALSLNLGIVHRPPAQLSPAAVTATASSGSVASTSATVTQGNIALPRNVAGLSAAARKSLSRSGTPTARPATKTAKKRSRPSSRATSNEPHPEPREPEFTLPDPSAPPPSHFLRNQENLLGKAGVVAGVKPSTLTHARGSTPSNPIVVEEEDDTPKLGRRSGGGFARPYIDPSLLTAPTNQEIVQVLIGQKDIFPILEGVLKLVVGNAAATIGPRPTAFQSRGTSRQSTPGETSASTGSEKPPPKKRKLQHVPAGAADWDVPYPFKEGEGPEAYEKTWERERGKQLISQLIQQIKIAARKAATKKYLQQQQEKQLEEELEKRRRAGQLSGAANKLSKYYRPATATYGLPEAEKNKQVCDVLQDASNTSWVAKPVTPSQSQGAIPPSSRLEQNPATSIPSLTPSKGNAERQHSMTPTSTFQQLTDSYIASVEGNVLQGCVQGSQANAATSTFDHQGLNSNSAFTPQSLTSASASTSSSLPTTLDQSSFDSWMNLFLQSMPPSSFDFSQLEDLSGMSSMTTSALTSQCGTPAHPSSEGFDTFDFGDMLGPSPTSTDTSAALAASASNAGMDTDDSDMSAVLNAVFHQPQPLPAASGDALDTDFNFDFGNLDFSSLDATSMSDSNLNLNSTFPTSQEAASPNSSASSFTGTSVTGPATPASATWDISLPDVGGSNGPHFDVGGSGGDQSGQGMWLDGLWDFTGTNAYAGFTPLVGWDAGLSVSMGEPMQDFEILPEPHHEGPKENIYQSGAIESDEAGVRLNLGLQKVDKGKGRAVEPVPLLPATSNGMSFADMTSKEAAFRALVGAPLDTATPQPHKFASTATSTRTSTPAFSLSFTASPTPTPAATTISVGSDSSTTSTPAPALPTARDLRRQRRMDIIKRAREKRQRLQDELDDVKKQLWATTVEQAGLLLMLRKVEEGEARQSADVSLS